MNKKIISPDLGMLSEPFKALAANQGLNIQVYDMLPTPIEIFAPDGMCIFVNRAMKDMLNLQDVNDLVGKYNLRHDPVCLEILGQELMDSIFSGEARSFDNFPAPINDVADRGILDGKPFEAAMMDLYALPVWEGDTFVCTITFFNVKNMYQGRTEITKAQEYIKEHWRDEFDIERVARSLGLSSRHFRRIFKNITDITPNEFYQNVKIEKIKEKLFDGALSIEQVFDACGVDSRNTYLKLFKEKVGMSPADFRKKHGIK
jgi:AraC-like DNA-binding protein